MEVWREAQGGPSQGVAAAHRPQWRRLGRACAALRCHPVPPESAAVAVSIKNAAAVASWLSLDEFGSTNSLTMLDEDTIVCGACECARGVQLYDVLLYRYLPRD